MLCDCVTSKCQILIANYNAQGLTFLVIKYHSKLIFYFTEDFISNSY